MSNVDGSDSLRVDMAIGDASDDNTTSNEPVVDQMEAKDSIYSAESTGDASKDDYEERLRQAYAVKKPMNAFIAFQADFRDRVRRDIEGGAQISGNMSLMIRESWGKLTAEEKQGYQVRFQTELADYHNQIQKLGFDPKSKLPPLPSRGSALPFDSTVYMEELEGGRSIRSSKLRQMGTSKTTVDEGAGEDVEEQPQQEVKEKKQSAPRQFSSKIPPSIFPTARMRALMSLALRLSSMPPLSMDTLEDVVSSELIPLCLQSESDLGLGRSTSKLISVDANLDDMGDQIEQGDQLDQEQSSKSLEANTDTHTDTDTNMSDRNAAEISSGDADVTGGQQSSSQAQSTESGEGINLDETGEAKSGLTYPSLRAMITQTDKFRFGSIAHNESVALITKAAEMFTQWLGSHLGRVAQLNSRGSLAKEDVEQLLAMSPVLQFARTTFYADPSTDPSTEPLDAQPEQEKPWRPRPRKFQEIGKSAYEGVGSGSVLRLSRFEDCLLPDTKEKREYTPRAKSVSSKQKDAISSGASLDDPNVVVDGETMEMSEEEMRRAQKNERRRFLYQQRKMKENGDLEATSLDMPPQDG